MQKRQRIATGFLFLTCLVILVCMAQRVANLHALQILPQTLSAQSADSSRSAKESPVTPCELSAKALCATPLLFDSALPLLGLLLIVLALLRARPLFYPPAREFRAPRLRIHLLHCNFRE